MLDEKISTLGFTPPVTVPIGTSVDQVVAEVQRHQVGCVLISDDGELAGIMTERDVLMKVVARDISGSEPVDKFMTPDPVTLSPDHTIGEAIALMNRRQFRHIPIVDPVSKQTVAVFSIKDVIDYLVESFPEQVINLPPRPHQKMETREGA